MGFYREVIVFCVLDPSVDLSLIIEIFNYSSLTLLAAHHRHEHDQLLITPG